MAECSGLLNRRPVKRTEGSNPSLSAHMQQSDFHEFVMQDLLADIPSISSRSMFGGYGIYKDNFIFALIAYDVLYFKVNETNKFDYITKKSKPFMYEKDGQKPIAMSYWEVPADVLDDKEELKKWVEKSYKISKTAKLKKIELVKSKHKSK